MRGESCSSMGCSNHQMKQFSAPCNSSSAVLCSQSKNCSCSGERRSLVRRILQIHFRQILHLCKCNRKKHGPRGVPVASQAARIVPGNNAFPARHSDFATSQASTLGRPVYPAALIRNFGFDSFRKLTRDRRFR